MNTDQEIESMRAAIALFDIDGVMIQPGGYRAAFQATLGSFLQKMKLNDQIKLEGIPELYESIGITSEWDMIPITLAIILQEINLRANDTCPDHNLEEAFRWAAQQHTSTLSINFKEEILKLKKHLSKTKPPSDEILFACLNNPVEKIFPGLIKPTLLKTLLQGTRDFRNSETSRIFEHLIIGTDLYEQIYGVRQEPFAPSYLQTYDRLNIDLPHVMKLKQLIADQYLHAAFITARPSLAPKEIKAQVSHGYIPEGEIARSLIGLDEVPLIGIGRLKYIADQHNLEAEELLKPVPFQALAAIAAAWTGSEDTSLQWAYEVHSHFKNHTESTLFTSSFQNPFPTRLEIHIFEDTTIGIESCKIASSYLTALGIHVDFHSWGISKEENKRISLQNCGASVYTDINHALDHAYQEHINQP